MAQYTFLLADWLTELVNVAQLVAPLVSAQLWRHLVKRQQFEKHNSSCRNVTEILRVSTVSVLGRLWTVNVDNIRVIWMLSSSSSSDDDSPSSLVAASPLAAAAAAAASSESSVQHSGLNVHVLPSFIVTLRSPLSNTRTTLPRRPSACKRPTHVCYHKRRVYKINQMYCDLWSLLRTHLLSVVDSDEMNRIPTSSHRPFGDSPRVWTTYHLTYDRTSATDNSNDNWKHFCSGLTDHDTSWMFAYLHLRNTLTYLLTYTWLLWEHTAYKFQTLKVWTFKRRFKTHFLTHTLRLVFLNFSPHYEDQYCQPASLAPHRPRMN